MGGGVLGADVLVLGDALPEVLGAKAGQGCCCWMGEGVPHVDARV